MAGTFIWMPRAVIVIFSVGTTSKHVMNQSTAIHFYSS
jgi:hypothetical protein